MTLDDLKRFLDPIRRRLMLLLGRAVLVAVNNAGTTQRLQVVALADEVITDVERFQDYGFEGYPWPDAQAAILFMNGNRDAGIVVAVHDRRYRPTDLVQGEVAVYTDEDKTTPFRVQLKRGRILYVRAQDFSFYADRAMTLNVGTTLTETVLAKQVNAATSYKVASPVVQLGNLGAALQQFVDDRFVALFNSHIHSGVLAGGANTGAPVVAVVAGNCCTSNVKGN